MSLCSADESKTIRDGGELRNRSDDWEGTNSVYVSIIPGPGSARLEWSRMDEVNLSRVYRIE